MLSFVFMNCSKDDGYSLLGRRDYLLYIHPKSAKDLKTAFRINNHFSRISSTSFNLVLELLLTLSVGHGESLILYNKRAFGIDFTAGAQLSYVFVLSYVQLPTKQDTYMIIL